MSSFDINSNTNTDHTVESFHPDGHTFRTRYNWGMKETRDIIMRSFENTHHYDGLIPITEVDSLLSLRDITYFSSVYRLYCPHVFNKHSKSMTLNKQDLFNDIIAYLEQFASKKKVTYNKHTGLDEYVYDVPIVEYVNEAKIARQIDIREEIPCIRSTPNMPNMPNRVLNKKSNKNKRRGYKYYEAKKQSAIEAHYVTIDGNRYNANSIYERSTDNMFVPIVKHAIPEITLGNDERSIHSKITYSKKSITITFSVDSNIIGFILKPEPMVFDQIYNTTLAHSGKLRQNASFIRVMTNKPNYITKFKMFFRSTNTNGQWIEYGIFDGNTSIFDQTKIVFDEIVVKEIRLIPITHTGSFRKVCVSPFTHHNNKIDDPANDTITYTLYLTHKTHRPLYSREMDCITKYHCDSNWSPKGIQKDKSREFANQCSDF